MARRTLRAAVPIDPHLASDLVASLRGWYHSRRRVLPWREEPTPYRVWVSEIMLQQTQVVTVIPYFERFIARFPDVRSLAEAPGDDVIAAWAGLGYYRRARHLHATAKLVAAGGGVFPKTPEELQRLPGVGRYTAGAIASIAYGTRAALLDGNVARVLSRVFCIEHPVDRGPGQATLWGLADALVPGDDPSSHNQALMELGALVCTPRQPACGACPVADRCQALARGRQEELPVKSGRAVAQPVSAVAGLCTRPGTGGMELLLAKRPEGLLGGLWELPGGELDLSRRDETGALERLWKERVGLSVTSSESLGSVFHQFTHRSLTLTLYRVEPRQRMLAVPGATAHYPALQWCRIDAPGVPLSTLTHKVLALARAALVASPPAQPTCDEVAAPRKIGRSTAGGRASGSSKAGRGRSGGKPGKGGAPVSGGGAR